MDIFDEVKQVLVACETPREFIVAVLGEDWRKATLATYRMRPDSDIRCYLAMLTVKCPDCGEPTPAVVAFTESEQGGYRLLKPEQVELPL